MNTNIYIMKFKIKVYYHSYISTRA